MSDASEASPHNPKNVIISANDVNKLLHTFGSAHKAKNVDVYRCAMVHRSYCTRKNETVEQGNAKRPRTCVPLQSSSNERLEFLGDAVINLIIGTYVYNRYIDQNEGFLTTIRTKLVCGTMLAFLASCIKIQPFFIISQQLESGGRDNAKLLEDMFEAFVGAFYIDTGNDVPLVSQWLIRVIEDHVDFTDLVTNRDNPKVFLQKHFQRTRGYVPTFETTGVDVANKKRVFTVSLRDRENRTLATASGHTKKSAEIECAAAYMRSTGIS